jgi:hypothetical protein
MTKRERESDEFDFFAIDEHRLDKEWVNQPTLFFTWARKLADARQQLEEAKASLDVVYAELDNAIRERPGKYGLEKITESAIKQLIPSQAPYAEALAAVNTTKHRVDVLQAAVTALEHRKRALENLVDLHGQNYFAEPTAPAHSRERVQETTKQQIRKRGQRVAEGD